MMGDAPQYLLGAGILTVLQEFGIIAGYYSNLMKLKEIVSRSQEAKRPFGLPDDTPEFVQESLNESFPPEGSWTRMILVAVAILIAVAILMVIRRLRQIMCHKKERRKEMKCFAWYAVQTAINSAAEEDTEREKFIQSCTQLAICAQLSRSAKDHQKVKIAKRVKARAKFYVDPDIKRPGYYLPQDSEKLTASYLIGLLTDLSPLWIYDCGTNRKGDVPVKDCEDIIRKIAERSVPVDTTADTTQSATSSNGEQPRARKSA